MIEGKKNIYFEQLDVLRFFSAFLVLVLHVFDKANYIHGWPGIFYNANGSEKFSLALFKTFVNNCAYGVDIFFLISGFLITYLLLVEKSRLGKINIKQFYLRRIFRIWPLYFLIIFLGPLFTYYFGENRPIYWKHLLFIGNFSLIKEGWVSANVSHLWSICIEEHFYLVWPLLVNFLSPKKFFNSIVLALGFVICYKMYLAYSTNPDKWMYLYLSTFSRCDTLLLGAIAGYIYHYKPFEVNISLTPRIVVYSIFILYLMIDNISQIDNFFEAVFKRFFYCVIVLFWVLNYLFNPNAILSFKKGIFNYLGKASYSFYMWHPLVLVIVLFGMNLFNIIGIYICFIVTFVLSIIVSLISFEYFEKPFLKIKDNLFSSYKND